MRILARTSLALCLLALLCAPAFAAGPAKDVETTPQAKAYRALLKTVDAGDYEAYKKAMASESAKTMDQQLKDSGMDAKKAMAFLKAMSPTHLKLEALLVDADGKKSTLKARGEVGGEVNKGTIDLVQENGQWKVAKQSWTNK